MRVKSKAELKALEAAGKVNPRVAAILRKHLEDSQRVVPSDVAPRGMHTHKHASATTNNARKAAREHFYVFPEWDKSPDPEVMLYRACVARWGRAFEGGLCVYELGFQVHSDYFGSKPKRWFIDTAIPKYRIAIECDGYQYHSSLDAIKRDHLKNEFLHRHGWLVFRVGNARIKKDIDTFLDSVEHAMRFRTAGTWKTHAFKGTKQRASYRSLLLSWEPCEHNAPTPELYTLPSAELQKYG